jgi:hypothetical protein
VSKTSGIGSYLFVGAYDLSGDIGAISSIATTRNLQDISNIQQTATQRLALLRDGSLAYNAFFNAAAGGAFAVLHGFNGAQALFTWASGNAAGDVGASLRARQADFGTTRGQDGSLAITASAQGDGYGLEWANMLTTGKQTFASTGNGTTVDDLFPLDAATTSAFGLAAYIHAISLGSGTATVAVQDSADDISYGNVVGGGFTDVTGATSERIQTATDLVVKRYLRVNVTGTFTNLVAAVSVVRYRAWPPA